MANVRGLAIRDWRRLSVSSFNIEITFNAPSPSTETATIKGIATNNAITFETDGQDAIGHSVHISFSEAELVAANANYPVRATTGESAGLVDLLGHRASFIDANGTTQNYVITNHYPDNTVGIIACDCNYFRP